MALRKVIFLMLLSTPLVAQRFTPPEITRWKQQAKRVSITRDTWGVPHIKGKSDADAVFGMLYVQCEDDFERVERNYITATARMAEVEGETYLYNDLRMRLFMDTAQAIKLYATSPDWMKKVCTAFADGANYYLYTHQKVRPRLIRRFQPWMPLLFSEGSIGGDIDNVSLNSIREFYGKEPGKVKEEVNDDGQEPEPKGSNGFAIGPSRSASGAPLLLINPHTSFYFRSELHMSSDEGLNAYGAVTWGQFFIYQGFNEHCGWMHTTSQADVVDYYKETVVKKGNDLFYKYGDALKPLKPEKITLRYKGEKGISKREFSIYHTHHGPVIAQDNGKWISVRLMQEPVKALTQSYLRTKSVTFEDFKNTMSLRTNSSNNTVYADDQGNIAYWHGDFIPRRDPKFDWSAPVDGSDPATEWKDLHTLDEIIHLYNPASGWIQNCNSTPFTATGTGNPEKNAYPSYMAPDAENTRGLHAVRVLKEATNITLDKLITISQDSYLPAFETLVPSLIRAFDGRSITKDTLTTRLSEPIALLRSWDLRYSSSSIPTTLAIFWAQRLRQDVMKRMPAGLDQLSIYQFLETQTSHDEKLNALSQACRELQRDFGTWKQPWGEINRFQRLTGKIEPTFDDQKQSLPVAFTSSYWGSLAAFGSKKFPGTKKMYGYVGNSFVAVVEFGKRVKAKSVVTGGSSSDLSSIHFNDQSLLYSQGQFKDIWFYKEDYMNHAERTYYPGQLPN